MLVYYSLLFFAILFIILEERSPSKNRYLTMFFAMVFCVVAFRADSVGSDTAIYIDEYINNSSYIRNADLGYSTYTSFLNRLGVSPILFLFITSAIILFPHFFYVRKCSAKKVFTLFLYLTIGCFSMHMSGLRQSMAIGLTLLGYVIGSSVNKRIIRYLLLAVLVYIASTIHGTAVVCYLFIPMLWLSEKPFNFGRKWLIFILALPIVAIFVSSFFASVVNYFMITRYEDYELGYENINIIAFFIIPYCIFFYLTCLKFQVGCRNSFERFGYMCAFMYVMCASASMYMPMLSRIGYYFSLPTLSLIGTLTNRLNIELRRTILFVLIVFCIAFFMISIPGGTMKIDNYHFFFE